MTGAMCWTEMLVAGPHSTTSGRQLCKVKGRWEVWFMAIRSTNGKPGTRESAYRKRCDKRMSSIQPKTDAPLAFSSEIYTQACCRESQYGRAW